MNLKTNFREIVILVATSTLSRQWFGSLVEVQAVKTPRRSATVLTTSRCINKSYSVLCTSPDQGHPYMPTSDATRVIRLPVNGYKRQLVKHLIGVDRYETCPVLST
jgi:hypothetical protein